MASLGHNELTHWLHFRKQIVLNETRDKLRETNQKIVDMEEGILQLKEDLIQERADARMEKKRLKKAVVSIFRSWSNSVNPLGVESFWWNIKMHLHILSFPDTEIAQVVEILPHGRQEPVYLK